MSDIKADISIWFDEYDVDGIFIDEVSNRLVLEFLHQL